MHAAPGPDEGDTMVVATVRKLVTRRRFEFDRRHDATNRDRGFGPTSPIGCGSLAGIHLRVKRGAHPGDTPSVTPTRSAAPAQRRTRGAS